MERGKGNEGERENSSVSSAVFRKDIVNLRNFIGRLKNEEDQIALDMDQVEALKLVVTLMWTFLQLSSSSSLDGFSAKISNITGELEDLVESLFYNSGDDILVKYDMDCVVPRIMENIRSCINSQHSPKSSATMAEEQLVELLDSLLVNLHDITNLAVGQFTPFITQLEVLRNVFSNVRNFYGLTVNGCVEHEIIEYMLPQFQLMAERAGHFFLVCIVEELEGTLDVKLGHLFVKIIPIALEVMHICSTNLKASKSTEFGCFIKQLLEASPAILREYLIYLQEHIVNVINPSTSTRNIHVMIEFLLIILTDMPKDFIRHDKLFDLLARLGALTREVSILVHRLQEKSRNEGNTNETYCGTLDLLENIELLKGDLRHVYLKVPNSSKLCFPMSDGLLFMNLLLRNLNALLNSNAYSVSLIKEEIELVKEHLECIRFLFVNVEHELCKDHWIRALDVAYEAEHSINSILVKDHGLLQLIFLLPDTIEKIKLIKEDVFNLVKKSPENRALIVEKSPNKPVVSKSSIASQVLVGFEEERDYIIRKLICGPTDIDVISIVGMPGLGKTTLAYRVYNDKSVISHFDILAWCTVDQERNERILLQKIFNQVTNSNEKFSEDIDVVDKLRKKLYGGRYLIVLDDLWDTATWDELTRPFPDIKKGSRIILTSRKKEVALHAKRHSEPLDLRFFTVDESWDLIKKRVFGEESCPNELLGVGKGIAQNCQGLPLVADLIAGVLAKKGKKKTLWLEVLNNLDSFILENEVEVMKVIQLSYDHLADHVKPCLLFLGSYPKDEEISVCKLQDLWSAEGILEQTEMKSVKEVMEVYLDNLISSSLVIVKKSKYVPRTCKIHDLVHDFCQVKATKEKFFDLISSSALSCASDLMPRRMTIPYDRVSVCKRSDSEKKVVSGKYLLSLKVDCALWRTDGFLVDKIAVLVQLRDLRLLRVLDLPEVIHGEHLLNEIGLLVHLKYLNIGMRVKALPLSLTNLWNLETLLVQSYDTTIVLLPRIWNLAKLQHVSIRRCSFFDLDTGEPILLAEDSKLDKLRILDGLRLSYSKDTEDILKRFPKLKQLVCKIVESWDASAECNWFPKLDVLNELEELKATYLSATDLSYQDGSGSHDMLPFSARHLSDFRFPLSLKKLTLLDFNLTSDSLSTIARLPILQKLTLVNTIIQEEEWNVGEDNTFENLKYLGLVQVRLSTWQVEEESFPVLEQLLLRECNKLEEIPSSFGDIASLRSIELIDSPQLEDSALEIKEYVADMMGDDRLQVHVQSYRE
ncbi:putative late blight resistance protein homolog R1A-3 [Nicotiana tabacum]|uniref:Late blight resistance protein homolog R1A-3 n=1 Tax=Nicotiana tabacum TaxID=4097 RepID=A0A1S3XN94_TOBAC|nr:PREDICTED: putative late blight resistance protein homolog R1A-3 [Nicotiana tabacum]XP_016441300.1 PREDICTED: putative late blight resistance protein homolog R1A-3 [Nicotiana tabacum]